MSEPLTQEEEAHLRRHPLMIGTIGGPMPVEREQRFWATLDAARAEMDTLKKAAIASAECLKRLDAFLDKTVDERDQARAELARRLTPEEVERARDLLLQTVEPEEDSEDCGLPTEDYNLVCAALAILDRVRP